MDANEWNSTYDDINTRAKREKRKADIARWGACPDYKGHFDKTSFWVGFMAGAAVVIVFVLILAKITANT